MELNTLKRKTKNKKTAQVGRGGTRGKTSGRGTKGQNARAGRKKRPELRDIIKKMPKMRGRGKNSNLSIQSDYTVLNLETISQHYKAGETVNAGNLVSKKILKIYKGRAPKVKIVSGGEIGKINFSGVAVTATAKAKIEKAGGTIKA